MYAIRSYYENRKLVIDCCLPYKNFDYSSTIQDVINYIKEQNTYIIPVFRNESFYGILISIHIFEQLVSEQDELSKKIQETETEISHYKSRSLIPEQIRNELLNNISHEFRTPANAIVGFSELVCEKNMDEAKRNYFLGIIRSSGFRLLKLIDDFVITSYSIHYTKLYEKVVICTKYGEPEVLNLGIL